jgi:two-component system sensor histidine kinase/response regulator
LRARDRRRATRLSGGGNDEPGERKAMEAALREVSGRYNSIFDNAQDFIFAADSANRFTSITDYFSKATGYGRGEIIGVHMSKFFTPESFAKAMQMLSEKLQGESAVARYEVEALAKDGHVIPIELNTSLIYRDGRIVGIQGIGRDITERRGYELALRESEEKYRGLFENVGDFAYGTDLKGNFTAAGGMLLEATGFERRELISIIQILSPENLALAQKMTAAKLAGEKQATRYELEITAKDGRRIPVEIVSTLIYKEGKPVGVQGIGRDIAERKRAEEALRRSESNYRELMEQATEPIFIYDHHLQCVDVNRAAQEVFGFSREEFLTFTMRDLVHPDDLVKLARPEEQEKLRLMREGKLTIYGDRRLRRKDGSYIAVQISAKSLPDGRILSIKRDVSEWIAREAELREANAKAEAANRAKSEFLANMSHEIRTPMNSVIGMARLALLHEADTGQRGYLEKILLSGEHLLDIIDDILDFSKIDAGKLKLKNIELDIIRIVENLTGLLADQAQQKDLRYTADIDPAIPRNLSGDPLRLRQVMLNFISNAIKFTAKGEVAVSVRRVDENAAGCLVHFEVRDTGIGISENELSGLFQSFQQADNSVTRQYGGTGLGLAISKRLVELMGGEVGVESELGRGSRFWFRVWLQYGTGKVGSSAGAFLSGWFQAYDALRGKHILLVENNPFNQQVAREFLENVGVIVVVANNGAEALDLLWHESFDGVLMDLHMPVMDGLEASRQIRANPNLAAMPVIAMTANVLEEERKRCLNIGMNDFITKPVRPEMLYAMLAHWLSPGGVRDAPAVGQTGAMPESESQEGASPIDLSALEEMIGSKPERVREFALRFLATTRADMARINDALERQDMAQLRELAHHIKSPAAMMGAAGFAELSRKLENEQNTLEQNRGIVRQLQAMLERIEAQIRKQFP